MVNTTLAKKIEIGVQDSLEDLLHTSADIRTIKYSSGLVQKPYLAFCHGLCNLYKVFILGSKIMPLSVSSLLLPGQAINLLSSPDPALSCLVPHLLLFSPPSFLYTHGESPGAHSLLQDVLLIYFLQFFILYYDYRCFPCLYAPFLSSAFGSQKRIESPRT